MGMRPLLPIFVLVIGCKNDGVETTTPRLTVGPPSWSGDEAGLLALLDRIETSSGPEYDALRGEVLSKRPLPKEIMKRWSGDTVRRCVITEILLVRSESPSAWLDTERRFGSRIDDIRKERVYGPAIPIDVRTWWRTSLLEITVRYILLVWELALFRRGQSWEMLLSEQGSRPIRVRTDLALVGLLQLGAIVEGRAFDFLLREVVHCDNDSYRSAAAYSVERLLTREDVSAVERAELMVESEFLQRELRKARERLRDGPVGDH